MMSGGNDGGTGGMAGDAPDSDLGMAGGGGRRCGTRPWPCRNGRDG